MYRILLLAILLTSAIEVGRAADSMMISPRDCFADPYSSVESWRRTADGDAFDISRIDDKDRQAFKRTQLEIECRTFMYDSDGIDVGGFYVRPRNTETKLPVIIFNRGGTETYGNVDFGLLYKFLFDFARAGFIVIGSQYRGGLEGVENGGNDEWGGADVNDVLRLFDLIDELPFADDSNIGMLGASRGAMMMFLAAKRTTRLRALASWSGSLDLVRSVEFKPQSERKFARLIPGYEQSKDKLLRQRSALYWVDELSIEVPILLLHGNYDNRVDPASTLQFAAKLQQRLHPYQLVMYEADDHDLSHHHEAAKAEIVSFFKRHLAP